jgi:hypothetical protein
MGTCYVVVDAEQRNGLDVGKFYALAVAAGCDDSGAPKLLTLDHVRAAALGWESKWPGPPARMQDVLASAGLAALVERWIAEVCGDRLLTICEEGGAPWGNWQGHDSAAADWTLWTLYTHPMHNGDAAPPWRLFPARGK